MRFRFTPANRGEQAASAPAGQPQVAMVAGESYDLDPAWAERLLSIVGGVNGAPCLIPLDPPGHEAAREFIAAISTPTTFNPETPPAAASDVTPEPVKRKPGRKPRG